MRPTVSQTHSQNTTCLAVQSCLEETTISLTWRTASQRATVVPTRCPDELVVFGSLFEQVPRSPPRHSRTQPTRRFEFSSRTTNLKLLGSGAHARRVERTRTCMHCYREPSYPLAVTTSHCETINQQTQSANWRVNTQSAKSELFHRTHDASLITTSLFRSSRCPAGNNKDRKWCAVTAHIHASWRSESFP